MKILISSIVDLERVPHNRIHEFVRFLSHDHEITVLSIRDWWRSDHPDVDVYRTHFEESLKNVEILHLTNRRIRPFVQEMTSVASAGTILDRIDSRFDVHLNYNTLVCGFVTTRKMRKQRIGTVFDIADDLPEMIGTHPQIPSPLRPFGKILARLIYQKNVEMSAKITLTTPALKESCSISDDKCEILPNGVDDLLFRNHRCKDLKERLCGSESFVIGYVGVLREWVDLEPMFAAVRQLAVDYPMMKILILGEEGGLTKPKELAADYALSDRVVFTGTIPYLEIPRFISCMDVGIIPFRSNRITTGALPLKLFEYLACERPVISTPLPGVKQMMEDSVIYASNETEFVAAIAALYKSPSRRKELGQAGRRFVEKNHSWRLITSRLEQTLQEVAEAGRMRSV